MRFGDLARTLRQKFGEPPRPLLVDQLGGTGLAGLPQGRVIPFERGLHHHLAQQQAALGLAAGQGLQGARERLQGSNGRPKVGGNLVNGRAVLGQVLQAGQRNGFGHSGGPIVLTVTSGKPWAAGDRAAGWGYLWLKYVWGFYPHRHCAFCLVGQFSKRVDPGMPMGQPHVMDEQSSWDYLYLCGIPNRRNWATNLHFPLQYEAGASCHIESVTGHVFHATNAKVVPIPALPYGFDRRDASFTTCRNWRFGVAHYGLPKKEEE